MAYRYACVLLTVALCATPALSFSAGAPDGACGDMIPQHHTDPQKSAAPYKILLTKKQIKSGEGVTVTVQGNTPKDTIKGLLCQARVGETPVGSFDVPPNNSITQTLDCGNAKKVNNPVKLSTGLVIRLPSSHKIVRSKTRSTLLITNED